MVNCSVTLARVLVDTGGRLFPHPLYFTLHARTPSSPTPTSAPSPSSSSYLQRPADLETGRSSKQVKKSLFSKFVSPSLCSLLLPPIPSYSPSPLSTLLTYRLAWIG